MEVVVAIQRCTRFNIFVVVFDSYRLFGEVNVVLLLINLGYQLIRDISSELYQYMSNFVKEKKK